MLALTESQPLMFDPVPSSRECSNSSPDLHLFDRTWPVQQLSLEFLSSSILEHIRSGKVGAGVVIVVTANTHALLSSSLTYTNAFNPHITMK